MCAAFAAAQGSPVTFQKIPAWPFWLFNRDLYRIIRFYSTQARGLAVLYSTQPSLAVAMNSLARH